MESKPITAVPISAMGHKQHPSATVTGDLETHHCSTQCLGTFQQLKQHKITCQRDRMCKMDEDE